MSLTQTVTQEQIAHAEHTAEGLRNEHDGIMLGDLGTPANSDQSAVHQQELGSPRSEHFEVQQRWNQPISNVWKLAATFYSFIAFGMNDACYGVCDTMYIFPIYLTILTTDQALLPSVSHESSARRPKDHAHLTIRSVPTTH